MFLETQRSSAVCTAEVSASRVLWGGQFTLVSASAETLGVNGAKGDSPCLEIFSVQASLYETSQTASETIRHVWRAADEARSIRRAPIVS